MQTSHTLVFWSQLRSLFWRQDSVATKMLSQSTFKTKILLIGYILVRMCAIWWKCSHFTQLWLHLIKMCYLCNIYPLNVRFKLQFGHFRQILVFMLLLWPFYRKMTTNDILKPIIGCINTKILILRSICWILRPISRMLRPIYRMWAQYADRCSTNMLGLRIKLGNLVEFPI